MNIYLNLKKKFEAKQPKIDFKNQAKSLIYNICYVAHSIKL